MPVSQLPFAPNPDGTCRACRGPLDPQTWLCARCGAAYGERNRCPHCRTIARTLPHPTLIRRCSVCGKPRLPPGPGIEVVPDSAKQQLLLAGHSNRAATIMRVLGWFMLALALAALPLTAGLIYVSSSAALTGFALTFVLIPLLVWLFLRGRLRTVLRDRTRAINGAYSSAILGTLGAAGLELDSAAIASLIGLPIERTEQLLAMLNADERMTSRVTDDGAVLFGVQPPARLRAAEPERLRFAESELGRTEIVDAEFADAPGTETESPSASRQNRPL